MKKAALLLFSWVVSFFGLVDCTGGSLFAPTSTNFTTNTVSSPQVRARFLTDTNAFKIGLMKYSGSTFAPTVEFINLTALDLNPTSYLLASESTNWVAAYAYWTGTAWSGYTVRSNTRYGFTNTFKYSVYLSGDFTNLTNNGGVFSVSVD
ncbi:MAG: hypothetical protein JNM63_09790 [Spirochaetia bacterium]|nr:hypothetical protein [Spirochaetia bacterium]